MSLNQGAQGSPDRKVSGEMLVSWCHMTYSRPSNYNGAAEGCPENRHATWRKWR